MGTKNSIISQTTPSHRMQLRSWLAELVMIRKYGKLPAFFWRLKRWRGEYTKEVRAISKFIKKYGNRIVFKMAEDPSVDTYTDFALMEFKMQPLRKLEMVARTTKDFSDPISPKEHYEDLRDYKPKSRNISLFDRLDRLNEI